MADTRNSGIFTFQEFKQRNIIKLAPDALVYIGGNLEMSVIAPAANDSKLNFNDGITSVNIQNNVDPPGSSTATIEINTPIYNEHSKYWVFFRSEDGIMTKMPVFVPMMEVKVFFKGRFMVRNEPKYYPVFWGFITGIEENFSGGVWRITLQCADILHWWAYSTITVHPVPESNIAAGGGQELTVYGTIFKRANPFSIIWKLFQNMGMNEFVSPTWLAQSTPLSSNYPPDQFRKVAGQIMDYWRSRFQGLGALLKMYGVSKDRVTVLPDGRTVIEPTEVIEPAKGKKSTVQKATEPQNKNFAVDRKVLSKFVGTEMLSKFTVFFDYEKMGDFQQAETMTKLDIATEVKTRTEFEFFQDVNGNFIFKPPFYNMDVKGIQPYEIEPHDVINCGFNLDSEGIVTCLQVNTAAFEQLRQLAFARGSGFHMDIDLAQKYGVRYKEMSIEYVNVKSLAKSIAVGQMNMMNAKTFTGSITIPGRPEMRLGYPIYLRHRDSYHYVKSISHAFEFGSSYTTTLSVETERKRSYHLENDQWILQKDKIYKYEGRILPDDNDDEKETAPSISSETTEQQKRKDLDQKVVSIKQGLYRIVDREDEAQKGITNTTVPYTDANGYRVIGAFPYGRDENTIVIGDDQDQANKKTPAQSVTFMGQKSAAAESDRMNTLFVPNEEGMVPLYLTTYNIIEKEYEYPPSANTTPESQGTKKDVDDTTKGKQTIKSENPDAEGQAAALKDAVPKNMESDKTNPPKIMSDVKQGQ